MTYTQSEAAAHHGSNGIVSAIEVEHQTIYRRNGRPLLTKKPGGKFDISLLFDVDEAELRSLRAMIDLALDDKVEARR